MLISHQSTASSLRTENRAAGLRGRQGRNQSGDKAAPVVLAAAGGWELGAALERGLLAAARAPGRRLRALLPGEEGGRERVKGAARRKKKLVTKELAEKVMEC